MFLVAFDQETALRIKRALKQGRDGEIEHQLDNVLRRIHYRFRYACFAEGRRHENGDYLGAVNQRAIAIKQEKIQ